jgi:hypothetical protein
VAFFLALDGADEVAREEFLRELDMPLDPMAQARMIMGGGG